MSSNNNNSNESSSSSNKISEIAVEKIKLLINQIRDENYDEIIKTCDYLLFDIREPYDDELKAAIEETRYKSMLQLEQFDKIIEIYNTSSNSSSNNKSKAKESNGTDTTSTSFLKSAFAYSLYRLDRVADAQQELSQLEDHMKDDSTEHGSNKAALNLLAQCSYNLMNPDRALKIYQKLLEQEATKKENKSIQLYTNMAATLAASAIPYVNSNSQDSDKLLKQMKTVLENHEKDITSFPYDLALNLATWRLTVDGTNTYEWQTWLEKAQKACRQMHMSNEGQQDDVDLQRELLSLSHNLEWSRALWSGSATVIDTTVLQQSNNNNNNISSYASTNAKLVQLHNRALSMPASSGCKLLPTKMQKATPLQYKILLYNRAVVALAAQKYDFCVEACDTLLRTIKSTSSIKGKKKKTNTSTTSHTDTTNSKDLTIVVSNDEMMWWQSRVAVVKAQCLHAQQPQKIETAISTIKTAIEQVQSQPVSTIRDHALGYLLLHQFALSLSSPTSADLLSLLQNLPESWKSRNGVLASLAFVYQQQNKHDQAAQILESTGNAQIFADFAMAKHDYAKAAELYQQAYENTRDDLDKARWVQALSYIDPEKAQDLWTEVEPELFSDNDIDLDTLGAELELKEIPRVKGSRSTAVNGVISNDSNNTGQKQKDKKKKSRESIMRQRAKKREKYLAKLEAKGLYDPNNPPSVDPERWLPKHERSNARKRRQNRGGGGIHKGAQGGISEKDAAKLDVVARQAARASGEVEEGSRSTAHLTVAGNNRRGGRRK